MVPKWFIIMSSFNISHMSGPSLGDSSQYSQYPAVNQNSVYDTNYDYSGYQSGELEEPRQRIDKYLQQPRS